MAVTQGGVEPLDGFFIAHPLRFLFEDRAAPATAGTAGRDVVHLDAFFLELLLGILDRAGGDRSGRPLTSLPLFARHDKGAGKKVKPITTCTGRNIVAEWVETILGREALGTITPHSFRHYFVTRILQNSGNLKLAQELARHSNIAVTQRYAHLSDSELDKGYMDAIEG